MEKTQTSLENPITAGGLTITAVIQTAAAAWEYGPETFFWGTKKPLFLLITSPVSNTTALRISGETISIEEIAAEYPELKLGLPKS